MELPHLGDKPIDLGGQTRGAMEFRVDGLQFNCNIILQFFELIHVGILGWVAVPIDILGEITPGLPIVDLEGGSPGGGGDSLPRSICPAEVDAPGVLGVVPSRKTEYESISPSEVTWFLVKS